jgi:hypothetical protein
MERWGEFASAPRGAAGTPLKRPEATAQAEPRGELLRLHGKVVELGSHLQQHFRMTVDDEFGRGVVALVTGNGEIYPLVRDVRSRGFFLDKRFRDRPVELHLQRFAKLPFVRLLDAFAIQAGKRCALEYWCSICAITTYEPGPCPCCQEPIAMRERPIDE